MDKTWSDKKEYQKNEMQICLEKTEDMSWPKE